MALAGRLFNISLCLSQVTRSGKTSNPKKENARFLNILTAVAANIYVKEGLAYQMIWEFSPSVKLLSHVQPKNPME